MSVALPVRLSVCLSVSLSVMSVCLSVGPFVCLLTNNAMSERGKHGMTDYWNLETIKTIQKNSFNPGTIYPELQKKLKIKLDDIACNGTSWATCEYSRQHNCEHAEDVFLKCHLGSISLDISFCVASRYYDKTQFVLDSSINDLYFK